MCLWRRLYGWIHLARAELACLQKFSESHSNKRGILRALPIPQDIICSEVAFCCTLYSPVNFCQCYPMWFSQETSCGAKTQNTENPFYYVPGLRLGLALWIRFNPTHVSSLNTKVIFIREEFVFFHSLLPYPACIHHWTYHNLIIDLLLFIIWLPYLHHKPSRRLRFWHVHLLNPTQHSGKSSHSGKGKQTNNTHKHNKLVLMPWKKYLGA